METRELPGGTEGKSVSSIRGHWFALHSRAGKLMVSSKSKQNIAVVGTIFDLDNQTPELQLNLWLWMTFCRDIKDTTVGTLSQQITNQLLGLKGLDAKLQDMHSYLQQVGGLYFTVNSCYTLILS